MATIRRHTVPADSFQPDAPINDLGREQLKHFIHVAERLPLNLRVDLPIPSPEDSVAVGRFIAAVTERLMSRKRPASQAGGQTSPQTCFNCHLYRGGSRGSAFAERKEQRQK